MQAPCGMLKWGGNSRWAFITSGKYGSLLHSSSLSASVLPGLCCVDALPCNSSGLENVTITNLNNLPWTLYLDRSSLSDENFSLLLTEQSNIWKTGHLGPRSSCPDSRLVETQDQRRSITSSMFFHNHTERPLLCTNALFPFAATLPSCSWLY